MKWLVSALTIVCVIWRVDADDKSWTKVDWKEGECRIEFPTKPLEQKNEKLRTSQLLLPALDGKASFMLQVTRLPKAVPIDQPEAVKDLFDRGERGVRQLEGKIIKNEDGKFGKYPTREIVAENVPRLGVFRARFVLTGERLYQITAGGPVEWVNGEDVKKFFESFKLD